MELCNAYVKNKLAINISSKLFEIEMRDDEVILYYTFTMYEYNILIRHMTAGMPLLLYFNDKKLISSTDKVSDLNYELVIYDYKVIKIIATVGGIDFTAYKIILKDVDGNIEVTRGR